MGIFWFFGENEVLSQKSTWSILEAPVCANAHHDFLEGLRTEVLLTVVWVCGLSGIAGGRKKSGHSRIKTRHT